MVPLLFTNETKTISIVWFRKRREMIITIDEKNFSARVTCQVVDERLVRDGLDDESMDLHVSRDFKTMQLVARPPKDPEISNGLLTEFVANKKYCKMWQCFHRQVRHDLIANMFSDCDKSMWKHAAFAKESDVMWYTFKMFESALESGFRYIYVYYARTIWYDETELYRAVGAATRSGDTWIVDNLLKNHHDNNFNSFLAHCEAVGLEDKTMMLFLLQKKPISPSKMGLAFVLNHKSRAEDFCAHLAKYFGYSAYVFQWQNMAIRMNRPDLLQNVPEFHNRSHFSILVDKDNNDTIFCKIWLSYKNIPLGARIHCVDALNVVFSLNDNAHLAHGERELVYALLACSFPTIQLLWSRFFPVYYAWGDLSVYWNKIWVCFRFTAPQLEFFWNLLNRPALNVIAYVRTILKQHIHIKPKHLRVIEWFMEHQNLTYESLKKSTCFPFPYHGVDEWTIVSNWLDEKIKNGP
jgi:hypothetical protein